MTDVEGPLDCQEIKPVNPKGNQPWILAGRIDAEASILWSSDVKNWLIGKNPDAGKDWRQEEKWTTEDEMVGWHHRLNGHEFEQIPRDHHLGRTGKPGVLQFFGLQRGKLLSNRKTTTNVSFRRHSAIALAKKSICVFLTCSYVKTGWTFWPTQYFFQTEFYLVLRTQNSSHLERTGWQL